MAETPRNDQFIVPLPGGRAAKVPLSVLESFVDPAVQIAHDPSRHEDDVTAHSASIDPQTGASTWHTEWELGHCEYTDEAGFPQTAYAWHRHPMGTEYTEIYQK